jgi:uncharacterized RDD family membrane protein YckC
MVTGFDYLSQDKALQEHWVRRFAAIVIDALIIYLPISLIFHFLGTPLLFPWFLTGGLFFFYCALFDATIGGTVGKMLLRLKTVSMTGKIDFAQAIMRNVSKIFAVFLLLDWVIGMAVDTKDPRQKWTDQIAKTSVMLY